MLAEDMAVYTKLTIRHSLGAKSLRSRSGRVDVIRQTMESKNHPKVMSESARQDDDLSNVLAFGLWP